MAPKCDMSALPPPCEQLKKSMLELGAEVSVEGLRENVDKHGSGLVHRAFNAYQRQLADWWPDTLVTRYNEVRRTRGAGAAGANGREELLLIYAKTQRAMRFGDYKLIRFPQVDRSLFFNVREDPHELQDLSGDAALQELRASFEDRLRAAQRRCEDPLAWTAAQQIPVDLDLTGKRWPPDRWQPEWIREKYWPQK